MKKLINGIIEFHQNLTEEYKEKFAKLALGQFPDALFIACSDSRVAPNVFASTDPGDLFVVRNVGNMVAPCEGSHGLSIADESEMAAIEFSVLNLGVKNIIVCGHSECGAMQALLQGRENVASPNLKAWLRHGENALNTLRDNSGKIMFDSAGITPHNKLSQLNVLQQIEHLQSYPIIQKKLLANELRLHAWWFDLSSTTVFWYVPAIKKFIEIDEKNLPDLLVLFDLK